jgi:hypothetical protein
VPVSVGLVPLGGGVFTPRFVPGSTDVYLVDSDGVGAVRWTAAGAEVGPIFSQEDGIVRDFVLAPDGEHYAYVVEIDDGKFIYQELRFGTLTDGDDDGSAFLGDFVFLREVVFHPNGELLYVDDGGLVRVFRASDGAELAPLPVNGLRNVDVSADDGRLLMVVQPILRDVKPSEAVGPLGDVPTPPGLYVAPPEGTPLTPIGTNGLTAILARWLRGWRNAPGAFSSWIR